jgi:hypothetical protein
MSIDSNPQIELLPSFEASETLKHLSPRVLRDLAAAIEYRTPQARAIRKLTPEGIERLADILLQRGKPTVGFYRRYSRSEAGNHG